MTPRSSLARELKVWAPFALNLAASPALAARYSRAALASLTSVEGRRHVAARLARRERYPTWIADRVRRRARLHPAVSRPGLLSLITTAYDTPEEYLLAAARSAFEQTFDAFEWILVDNGSRRGGTRAALAEIARDSRVRLVRLEENAGILGGMRAALERATGRYVLPFDSDDRLYPDALAIMARAIEAFEPALLYSDEDHLEEEVPRDAFWKPDWDPVLFANCCYIAHLCALDRAKALELGCYTFPPARGCHDWDSFFRFLRAGHAPRHVPEIVYSWRRHPQSCATGNIGEKSYVPDSHRAVLELHVEARGIAGRFSVEESPLFGGPLNWRFRRRRVDPGALVVALVGGGDGRSSRPSLDGGGVPLRVVPVERTRGFAGLVEVARLAVEAGAKLAIVSDAVVAPVDDDWAWEALGMLELHPDAAVAGGRLVDAEDVTLEGGVLFGVQARVLGCPEVGLHASEPGFFTFALLQRSVSAVPGGFCVVDPALVLELAAAGQAPSWTWLGAWLGATAAKAGRRVVYSPFLTARCSRRRIFPEPLDAAEEERRFLAAHASLVPDERFYNPRLSLEPGRPYQPGSEAMRRRIATALRAPASAGAGPDGAGRGPEAGRCRFCGGKARPRLRATDANFRVSDAVFGYSRCDECRSVSIDAVPEDLGRYYPGAYYEVPRTVEDLAPSLGPERYRIDLLLPFKRGGRLLEIGAGTGIFTELARRAGFEVSAIELDERCCEFLRKQQGIETLRLDRPESAPFAEGTFDAVALWHTLEHFPDPAATLRSASRWLKEGGVLLVATPNPDAFQFRLQKRWWPHLDAPRHLCLVPLRALAHLLGREGLKLVFATSSDAGGRFWNRFGWALALERLARAAGAPGFVQRRAHRLGQRLSRLLAPYETRGIRGSTYTAIFEKSQPEANRRRRAPSVPGAPGPA